jgi:malate dehydrogenase (oxaloacetate-decarboxylating)
MAASCERPIILPLSNPTSLSEADPTDVLRWTEGRAFVATGSPFPPVTVGQETFVVAQANNALVFPGLGLGTIVARASRVTPGMLRAAAAAVAEEVDANDASAPLLPPVDTLRQTSAAVAAAVARAAVRDGVARRDETALDEAVAVAMWEPAYRPLRPAR